MVDDSWRLERLVYHQRLASFGGTPLHGVRSPDGAILLSHADFDAYEGPYEKGPFLRLHLCTARVGRLHRRGMDGSRLDGVIRPGIVGITPPDFEAEGFWPRTQALAVMVHESRLSDLFDDEITLEGLEAAATVLHRDPLVSSVIYAMWRDAESHGLSSAFFDHGLALVLRRLSELGRATARVSTRQYRPFSRRKLRGVLDLIEDRIASDVRVGELAATCEQDVRSFTRSFRASTGFAPYEYLTLRRMERAKTMLSAGASVTDVALSVGYANPSKFSAAFRRHNGCTPSRWRLEQG